MVKCSQCDKEATHYVGCYTFTDFCDEHYEEYLREKALQVKQSLEGK